jgi:DNA-binding CsgD family transcriptional regulator
VRVLHKYSKDCIASTDPWKLLNEARNTPRQTEVSVTPSRQQRLSPADVDRLVERYAKLRSLRLVAQEFKIDRSTARGHLRDRHIDLVPPVSMTRDQVTAAIALYAEGKSSAAVGRALGFTNKTVIKELRAAGITIRLQLGRRT